MAAVFFGPMSNPTTVSHLTNLSVGALLLTGFRMSNCVPIVFKGIKYSSKNELCRKYNVNRCVYKSRINYGWTVAEALGVKKRKRVVTDTCEGKIYKITNNITRRAYIGLTTKSIEARFKEHVYFAVSGRSNNKLHSAIRKYGSSNFTIKLLYRSKSREELSKKEKRFIKKYKTDVNGYNTHSGGNAGGCSGKSIVCAGVSYHSRSALCQKFKVERRTFNKRRNKGWSVEESVGLVKRPVSGNVITYKGITYLSMKELAKAYDVPYTTLLGRINNLHMSLSKALTYNK